MGLNLRSLNILMTEEILNNPRIDPLADQMGCKRVPEKVRVNPPCHAGLFTGPIDGRAKIPDGLLTSGDLENRQISPASFNGGPWRGPAYAFCSGAFLNHADRSPA
jgi:hypothetical protein